MLNTVCVVFISLFSHWSVMAEWSLIEYCKMDILTILFRPRYYYWVTASETLKIIILSENYSME